MSTAEIRQRLHEYIDIAEDKKLKAIYTLLQNDIDYGGNLTEEQMAELDRRSYELEHGLARTYTWEETVDAARQKLKEHRGHE